jgi:sec-independent protein translocase protein TatA
MAPGWQQLLIVLVLALLLFGGRGKISSIMGDFAKGIKAFRKGLQDDDKAVEDKSGEMTEVKPVETREKTSEH